MCLADAPQEAQLTLQAHKNYVDHTGWEIPVNRGALRHIGNAVVLGFHGFAVNLHLSRQWRDDPKRGLQKGRFAGPIGTDNRGHSTFGQCHIHREYRWLFTIRYGQSTHGKRTCCQIFWV
jgi:hypothetical protein